MLHLKDEHKHPAPRGPGPGRLILLIGAACLLACAAEWLYRAGLKRGCARGQNGRSDGYFSLYVAGESTAFGEPYAPGITLGGLVSARFGDKIAGRKIRVLNLAKSGDSVYPQAVALERALYCRRGSGPGAVMVYAGHNDAGGRRGGTWLLRLRDGLFSRSMLLSAIWFSAEKHFRPLRVRTFDTYGYHLRRIVEMSLSHGLVPILSTVVSNITDMDPGLPAGPDLPRSAAREILLRGLEIEGRGQYKQALLYYSRQTAPSLLPYIKFRSGKCLQALGDHKAAQKSYAEAIDLQVDDNFKRASSAQNRLIKALAQEYSIPLADAAELFAAHSPHGLAGSALFADGHHPNLTGYLLLSEAYARQISAAFSEPVNRSLRRPQDAFKLFSYGPADQAAALVESGGWMLGVSAQHSYPEHRLKLAGAILEKAIGLDPHNFSAWLGLGLTEAARRGDLLAKYKNYAWMEKYRWLNFSEVSLTSSEIQEIVAKLPALNVPEELCRKIAAEAELYSARPRPVQVPARRPQSPAAPRGTGSQEDRLRLCGELARGGSKEHALQVCQSVVYSAGDGAGGAGPAEAARSEASRLSYKLLIDMGRPEEARELLIWAGGTVPPEAGKAQRPLK